MATSAFGASSIDLSEAKILVLEPQKKIMTNAADMLADEIEKRTRITLDIVTKMPGDDQTVIVIGNKYKLARKLLEAPSNTAIPEKMDAYSIWIDKSQRTSATICIAGFDDRGTLFAAGRLLRVLDMSRDSVKLKNDTAIATAPEIILRGHQIGYRPKTNSYDAWDLSMWEQYYRDMIVFGMNAVELIPPRSDDDDNSPHFPKPKLEMMRLMSQLAKDYGLDLWIWFPALDEDYTDKATVDAASKEWGEVFRTLPKINVVFVPGGDPGDTHPNVLFPFLEKQKKLLNKYHPNAQLWMSPQGFDWESHREDWMDIFIDIMQNQQPEWLDGIVFGPQVRMSLPKLRSQIPEKYPIRRYPDITHCRSSQYADPDWDIAYRSTLGREPINPRPRAYAKIFRDLEKYSMGFITYSEGCNDDFNKVLWNCLGWDKDMKVEDIAREYSRYFISNRYEEKFAKGILGLEENWQGKTIENENSYAVLELFQDMEANATPQELLNWRFQQGLYRAYYDAYIKQRLMYETQIAQQAKAILASVGEDYSEKAVKEVQAILDKADNETVAQNLRARVFELAEALYQSIRMQLSVKKYHAIQINRGANLDEIDKPLAGLREVRIELEQMRGLRDHELGIGLVEQFYSTSGFEHPEGDEVKLLFDIDHDWGDDRGNDWSARWYGYIEGPVTGEVTFSAQARDEFCLTIGKTVVIDGLGGNSTRDGKIRMVQGKKVPIKLELSGDKGKALLRLYWQWPGKPKQIVPGSSLSHSPGMISRK
jgi:hypothetical protein